MCHSITWYYGLCLDGDPEYSTTIPCQKALRKGYECRNNDLIKLELPLFGRCVDCKYKQYKGRVDLMRQLKTRNRSAALNAALEYDEEDWNSDSDDETESDIDLNMPSSPNFARSNPTDTFTTETRMKIHGGLARRAGCVIPSTPIVFHRAVIEDGEVEEDIEMDLVERSPRWRSWIPLPTRLLQTRSRTQSPQ